MYDRYLMCMFVYTILQRAITIEGGAAFGRCAASGVEQAHDYIYIYIYIHVYTYTSLSLSLYIYIYVYVCIYIYIERERKRDNQ